MTAVNGRVSLTDCIAILAKGSGNVDALFSDAGPVVQVRNIECDNAVTNLALSDGKCYLRVAFMASPSAASQLRKGAVIRLRRLELRVAPVSKIVFLLIHEVSIISESMTLIGSPQPLAPHSVSARTLQRLSRLRVFQPLASNTTIPNIDRIYQVLSLTQNQSSTVGTIPLRSLRSHARAQSDAPVPATREVRSEEPSSRRDEEEAQPPSKRVATEDAQLNNDAPPISVPLATSSVHQLAAPSQTEPAQPSGPSSAESNRNPPHTSPDPTNREPEQANQPRQDLPEYEIDADAATNQELVETRLPPVRVIANFLKSRRVAALAEHVDVTSVRRVTLADLCSEARAQLDARSQQTQTQQSADSGPRTPAVTCNVVLVLVEQRYGTQAYTRGPAWYPRRTLVNLLLSDHTTQIQACIDGEDDLRKFESLQSGAFYYLVNPELRFSTPRSLALQVVPNPFQIWLGRRTMFAPVSPQHLDDSMRRAILAECERNWFSHLHSLADVLNLARTSYEQKMAGLRILDPFVNVLVVADVTTAQRLTYDRSKTDAPERATRHLAMTDNSHFSSPTKPILQVIVSDDSMNSVRLKAWNDFSNQLEQAFVNQPNDSETSNLRVLFIKTVRAVFEPVVPVQQHEASDSDVTNSNAVKEFNLVLNTVEKSQIELLQPNFARTRALHERINLLRNLSV